MLPVDKLIEALALIATIKAIDLFASWLKRKTAKQITAAQ